MTTNLYDIGDVVRCSGVFTNDAGTALGPTSLSFRYRGPTGATTTLVYGVDGALLRLTTGAYYVDISPDAAGTWTYGFIATGTGKSAGEHYFRVRPSAF